MPLLSVLMIALIGHHANAASRIFGLHLVNGTAEAVTFHIEPGSCYEGTGCGGSCAGDPNLRVLGPVAPGGRISMTIARVQGNGCDGRQGYFAIRPSTYPEEAQHFNFDNAGTLELGNIPNRFDGVLSSKSLVDETYTWTMREADSRLSGPLDERLTMPRNLIARNFGVWDGGIEDRNNVEPQPGNTVFNALEFRRNGFRGMTYSECVGAPFFHAQHIVRLPNKDGHAYFMVTNSGAYLPTNPLLEGYPEGIMSLYRSDSVDPVTDLVIDHPGTDGEIVWEHMFWQGSPIGAWNHPCKMDVIGGVLIVCMLDWDSGTASCRDGNGRGSEMAIVFFDVRDPEHPKYWGKITASQLGIGKVEDASLVSTGDEWILYAGGKWWRTKNVSPNIEEWTYGGPGGFGGNQQGQFFNSYELYDRPGELAPTDTTSPGTERVMWGNGEGNDADYGDHVSGDEYVVFSQLNFSPGDSFFPTATATSAGNRNELYYPAPNLWTVTQAVVGGELYYHKKDYDACGVSVRGGMPVFYSPLVYYRDEIIGGDPNADRIWQIYNPANLALRTPHPDQVVTTLADSGFGSLRRAIAYGGKITFAPELNDQTITLTGGPLVIYLYDVNIDASALPNGIRISGNNASRVFEITTGNTVTLNNLTITGGNATGASLSTSDGGGIFNKTGTLTLTDCTLINNRSTYGTGAGIFNSGTLTLNRSTLTGNHADGVDGFVGGGGIYNGGTLTLNQSTISDNHANSSYGGGGIFSPGTLIVNQSTIIGNRADNGNGGGILNWDSLSVFNSIIAGNSAKTGPNIVGPVNYTGVSLTSGDPRLAPLADYGGPTMTMPPLPGSPAIDAGGATSFATDQRGGLRPTGPLPDIGAVEAFPFSTLPLVDTDDDGIDDRLEPAYGFIVGVDDRATDSDGDGVPDWQELLSMTDPNNPNDSLRIIEITQAVDTTPLAQWVADDWSGGTANWVDRIGGKIATVAGLANSPAKTAEMFPQRVAAAGLIFDGIDDYFSVAANQNPIVGKTSVTIAAFFASTLGASGADGHYWRYPGPLNAESGGWPNDWGLTYDATGNAHGFFNLEITPSPAVNIIDGQPHTMILTWQDPTDFPGEGVARLYVDGILAGSAVEPDGGNGIANDGFVIGSEKEQLLRYFSGAIGELRFYDSVQDAAAVHADLTGAPTEDVFAVTFHTFAGLNYELEFSDDLLNFTTVPDSQVTGTSTVQTLRIQLAPGQNFIRVRQW